ncbi:hypothetical protein OF001_U20308 [Pseudomonas sp. OF001]|uniref:AAA family ATPase n=1 Tax=Pseudomonas sp. OF001 TaxID=2772300 RepID=UPI00191B59AC|nr:AAA family ATPase [Pseudomonas sp. OF001]CAD5377381.1 hypothetical protein OF001_U20308 [Pseudomonas sp. OF001]
MKLIRLVAKNFKKLSDFAADFADGLNVLVGENAQGKSTTLQAIEAALFGVTVVPGKKENIPTWGQSTFNLELVFEVDNVAYVLTRTKSTAKLVAAGVDGEPSLLANGNTPVTKYIEELLGLTAKDFNLFVQSKQGETAGVLTFGATALSQKVEEFAGISVIDEVTRKAQERATTGKALATQLAVTDEEMNNAQAEHIDAMSRLDTALAELDAFKEAVDNLPQPPAEPPVSSEALTRTRREADKRIAALREAEAVLEAKRSALVAAEEALAAAEVPDSAAGIEEKLKQVKLEIANIRKRLGMLIEQKHRNELLIRQAEQAAKALAEAEVPASDLVIKFAENHLAELRADEEKAKDRLAVLASQRRTLESLSESAKCPTCGTQLSEHDPERLAEEVTGLAHEEDQVLALLEHARSEVKRLVAHISALTKVRDTSNRLSEEAEKAAALRPDDAEVQRLADSVEDLQDSLNLFIADQANLQTQLDRTSAVADRHNSLVRRQMKARSEVEAAVGAWEEAHSGLIAAPTDAEIDSAVAAEAEYRENRTAWMLGKQKAEADLKLAKAYHEQVDGDVIRTGEYLSSLQRMHSEAQNHATESDRASRLARFLRDRRQSYLKEVWDSVLAVASKHVNMATKGMITGIAYTDGEFSFEEAGIFAPVTSASGAQKAFIGTAVRIGLARVLYGSDSLLIFDEPTESMSESRAAGLSASLVGAAHQTILITHREQDQSLAANIITVGA